MAFVVPTKGGRFEVRESRSTAAGPRSRSLVSFTELTDEVLEKARAKAAKPPDTEQLRKAARRAGAPVAHKPVDRSARELIAELGKGRRLNPTLRHVLLDLLRNGRADGTTSSPDNEAAHEVAEWMAASLGERGKALVDLLLLTDALPSGGRRGKPLDFPRLDSSRR